jgi:hypothetical protein
MSNYHWTETFLKLHAKAVALYRDGQKDARTYFSEEETAFLDSIGAIPQELYDYAEDSVRYGEPDVGTALLIVAERRRFFRDEQGGVAAGPRLTMEDYPAKDAAFDGVPWLLRIILKAQTRLAGTMPLDMMYGCGGDRAFFKEFNLHPADFLRIVEKTGGDPASVLAAIRKKAV